MSHKMPLPARKVFSIPAGWAPALLLLGLGLVVFGLAFRQEALAAVRVWDNSATYNHCWLILPLAIWLAWTRRRRLDGLRPEPSIWLALLAVPPAIAWLAAERLGIMEGRQFAAIGLFWVMVLAILGWQVCRAMAAPLLYLVFLIPFGTFATPMLQSITAKMIDLGLNATGIPHYVDDLIIETPAGVFLVAEACAGLRFLIAALAFGALYAFTMFRSPGRRVVVMVLALLVPILANGLRAFGIVLLGSYLGSAEAAAADHVIYGWGFFSAVIVLLILAGLPFREDGLPDAPRPTHRPAPPARRGALLAAAILSVGLAVAGPAASYTLQQASARAPERRPIPLAASEACGSEANGLRCQDLLIMAQAFIFPAQVTWGAVSAERSRIAGNDDQDRQFSIAVPGAGTWRVRQSRDKATTVAIGMWLNGQPAGAGLRSRLEQAWNSLGGGHGTPVLVAITLRTEAGQEATFSAAQQRAMLDEVLQAQGREIAAAAATASSAARNQGR